ncbi:GDYXXLXY domain-containing protein [Phormidium pseudopriestleyi FRX01]|uniref:GDYXXLXY domain-containing protein n=1 Tax=Phormidium pseudopriestleyi FRX01 TaxID=1759528 RepID=A0ABS3FSD4_9CYAN|nr:GDYXXLXY domain-containing protein [Phormidium pseudopriestleyi]MBO0350028.1 GDYXXLXY domain-containing protein [Phormidium pseudopriestleyi FRX01]
MQNEQPSSPEKIKPSLVLGRFLIPLLIQTAAMLTGAFFAVHTEVNGKLVTLETEPVNLSKFIRNSSNRVSYNISNFKILEEIPGWEELPGTPVPCPRNNQPRNRENQCNPDAKLLDPDLTLYAILSPPTAEETGEVPTPWVAVGLSGDRPTELGENQVMIKGRSLEDLVEYEGGKFYLMRSQREEILESLDLTDQEEKLETLVIQLKVNQRGNAVPVNLWIGDRNYLLSN